jgi:hypothetical protein
MASIGNLSTMLTANAKELDDGLRAAGDKVKSFDEALTKGLQAQAAAAERTKEAFAAMAGAALSFGKSMIDNAFATAQSINDTRKAAERVGVSIEQMAAIEKFAGGQAEEFTRGLLHLNRTLGEVNLGSEEAAKKLQTIGVDAGKLLALPEFERIRSLLDFFKALPSELERAAAAEAVFGKGGLEMVEQLQRGSKALDEASDRVKRFYKDVYGAETADQVKQVLKDQKDLTDIWAGYKARAGVAMIDAFGGAFKFLSEEIGEIRENPSNALKQVLETSRFLTGWLSNDELEEIALRHVKRAGITHEPTSDIAALPLPEVRDTSFGGPPGGGFFGQTNLDEMQRIFERTRTPVERFTATIRDMDVAIAEGALDMETYNRELTALVSGLTTLDSSPHKFAGAADVHARSTYSAILSSDFGSRNESAQTRLERIQNQVLEESRRTAKNTQEMADAIRRSGGLKILQP